MPNFVIKHRDTERYLEGFRLFPDEWNCAERMDIEWAIFADGAIRFPGENEASRVINALTALGFAAKYFDIVEAPDA